MVRVAVLDQAQGREGAAVEAATNRWPVLVDRAALLSQMYASTVRAPSQHQVPITVPFRQQVGQARLVALLVHDDAFLITAR
jgi:hypothetical protein